MSALKHYTHIYISYELIIQKTTSEKEGKQYLEAAESPKMKWINIQGHTSADKPLVERKLSS